MTFALARIISSGVKVINLNLSSQRESLTHPSPQRTHIQLDGLIDARRISAWINPGLPKTHCQNHLHPLTQQPDDIIWTSWFRWAHKQANNTAADENAVGKSVERCVCRVGGDVYLDQTLCSLCANILPSKWNTHAQRGQLDNPI